jgi:hypothetical protein
VIAFAYIEIDRFVKDFLLDTDVYSVSRKDRLSVPLSGAIRFSHHSKCALDVRSGWLCQRD